MQKTKYKIVDHKQKKQKFLLASSGIRFTARIVDLICLFIILFFTGVSIFYYGVYNLTNHTVSYGEFISMMFGRNLSGYDATTLSIFFVGWKYCVFSVEVFVLFFLWFIIIPFLTKGRTIGKWICRITTINLSENKKTFFWHLIKKELFLWIILALVLLCYGFTCLGLNEQAYRFNISYIQNANANGFKSFSAIYIFVFLFSVSILIDMLVIIWMFFTSRKMNLQDEFSHTTVIYINAVAEFSSKIKDVAPDLKKENKNVLPGEINIQELDILLASAKNKKKKGGR